MFDRKSRHAINKKEKDAILYADAYGNIFRITAEDFTNIDEFRKWKELLTEIDHLEEKADHIYRNHNVNLSLFSESMVKVPSKEERIIAIEEKKKYIQKTAALMTAIREAISTLQYRRLWMYYIDGYNTHQIAQLEGTSHQAVSKSMRTAQKIILQISGKQVAKSPKN